MGTHKDEIKGKAKQIAGNLEQGVGRATDDKDRVAKGEAHEGEGKLQQGVGKVKQKAHDLID